MRRWQSRRPGRPEQASLSGMWRSTHHRSASEAPTDSPPRPRPVAQPLPPGSHSRLSAAAAIHSASSHNLRAGLARDRRPHLLGLLVRGTEAIGKKVGQRDIFLADKTLLRKFSTTPQIDHRTKTGRRGDLNGARREPVYRPVINLASVG